MMFSHVVFKMVVMMVRARASKIIINIVRNV